MLVLSRKLQESILIQTSDGTIEVKLCGFRSPSVVAIGIQAPDRVKILRAELAAKKPRPSPLSPLTSPPPHA